MIIDFPDKNFALFKTIGETILRDNRFNTNISNGQNLISSNFHNHNSRKDTLQAGRVIQLSQTHLPITVILLLGDAPNLNTGSLKNVLFWTSAIYTNLEASIDPYVQSVSPEWYSIYYQYSSETDKLNRPITKNFSCFINRMDVNRQSWFYHLIRRNLLSFGYVSFNLDIDRLGYSNKFTANDIFEQQYNDHMQNFSAEHRIAKNIIPYKNFDNSEDIENIMLECKVNLVLETYFSNNNELQLTEKIFRALVLPRPWLLFCSKHAVSALRAWGFDTLDDLIQHDRYDSIESDVKRQSILLDMLEEMSAFNIELHKARLVQAALHNRRLLETWKSKFLEVAKTDTEVLLDKIYLHHLT